MTPKVGTRSQNPENLAKLEAHDDAPIFERRSDRYATPAFAFLLVVGIAAGHAPRILAIRIVFAVLVAVVPVAGVDVDMPNRGKEGAER